MKMRCAIALCLCVLILFSVSEARSFTKQETSLKNRALSQLLSMRTDFNKKEVAAQGAQGVDGKETGGDDKYGRSATPPATIDVMTHAVACMLNEPMWQRLPAWGYPVVVGPDEEINACIGAIHAFNIYETKPEAREELDKIFRIISEAIKCYIMDGLDGMIEGLTEVPVFALKANAIVHKHCENRAEQMEAILGDKCSKEESEGPQTDDKTRNLMVKLRDLLSADLPGVKTYTPYFDVAKLPKTSPQRELDDGSFDLSYGGVEATMFAGICLAYPNDVEMMGLEEKCKKTIKAVKEYITAIVEKDLKTKEKFDKIFLDCIEEIKCGVFSELQYEALKALARDGTHAKKLVSGNPNVLIGVHEIVTGHCENRAAKGDKIADEMEHDVTPVEKKELLLNRLFGLQNKK